MKRANWIAMTLAACAGCMAFVARGGESAFDADAFVQRALEVTPSTPRDEMASLGKTADSALAVLELMIGGDGIRWIPSLEEGTAAPGDTNRFFRVKVTW